uniref:Uncharacterized protein n=1 Tax=Oryza meridionalis TaxID=40149 RepID=A0A0E0CAE7_9ORYZ
MDQRTSAQRRMAGRAARSGAVHSAASAITFSMAATTALVLRIRASIATTASPSRHFRSACVHTTKSRMQWTHSNKHPPSGNGSGEAVPNPYYSFRLVIDGPYVEPSCRFPLAPAAAAAVARCCSCWKSRRMDQRTSAQRRMAGRAARSGAVHSAASAITFSMAATTALVLRIRASIATTASPSRHFRSACVHTTLSLGWCLMPGGVLLA